MKNGSKPDIRADLAKDPFQVAAMFDTVAARYDLTNDLVSLGQVRVWRKAVCQALRPSPGMRILDLAAGTGTSSMEFVRAGADVVACDFSTGMVARGKQQHPGLTFVAGDATELPFADATFDAVTISFGLRNVNPTDQALREMARVTRPGGRLLVCEFSTPIVPVFRECYRFYLGTVMRAFAHAAASNAVAYDYLADSILSWPNQKELGSLISQCGWEQVQYRNLSLGIVALHHAVRT